jgi:hypothetical protein
MLYITSHAVFSLGHEVAFWARERIVIRITLLQNYIIIIDTYYFVFTPSCRVSVHGEPRSDIGLKLIV